MNIEEMKVKAYEEITELAWSEDNAEMVLQRILGVLYSTEQSMDFRSGELDKIYEQELSSHSRSV
jgi:hypothetical protein